MLAINNDIYDPDVDNQQKLMVLQVALKLFYSRGYGKVRFSDIARAAGITNREAQDCFPSKIELCHQVIDSLLHSQSVRFAEIDQNSNPRQRLSLFLDDIANSADRLMSQGCLLTNLYFDLHREKGPLGDHATNLIQQRLDWISEQFILITRVKDTSDLAERLSSALIGISILAQISKNSHLIRNQINQLKSWIRSL